MLWEKMYINDCDLFQINGVSACITQHTDTKVTPGTKCTPYVTSVKSTHACVAQYGKTLIDHLQWV